MRPKSELVANYRKAYAAVKTYPFIYTALLLVLCPFDYTLPLAIPNSAVARHSYLLILLSYPRTQFVRLGDKKREESDQVRGHRILQNRLKFHVSRMSFRIDPVDTSQSKKKQFVTNSSPLSMQPILTFDLLDITYEHAELPKAEGRGFESRLPLKQ